MPRPKGNGSAGPEPPGDEDADILREARRAGLRAMHRHHPVPDDASGDDIRRALRTRLRPEAPPRGRVTPRLDRLLEMSIDQREPAQPRTRDAGPHDERPSEADHQRAVWRERAFELLGVNPALRVTDLAAKIAPDPGLNPRDRDERTVANALAGVRQEFAQNHKRANRANRAGRLKVCEQPDPDDDPAT